jgi:hypothetical protein
MKLYTEEQVIRAIELSDGRSIDEVLAGLTPVELPSDDEIWKAGNGEELISKDYAFLAGAQWMRDKIQGDDK